MFGGGAITLAVLGWSIFALAQPQQDGFPNLSAEADPLPTGPPANATLFDSVASVTDADMHDGVWFLLDKRLSRVHRISEGNEPWSAFAGPGDGPGELRRARALVVHGDTVVVATSRRLQLYRPEGTYIGRREVEPPSICRHTGLGDSAAGLSDIASTSKGLLLLFTCTTGQARGGVFLEASEASYRPVVQDPGDPDDDLLDIWRDMSVLAAHPSGLVFGHPEDECIGLFGLGGGRLRSFCHAWLERAPVSRAMIEQASVEAVGIRTQIRIPEQYPPFDRVFVSDDALFYRTLTPTVRPGSTEVEVTYRLAKHDGVDWTSPAVPAAAELFVSDGAVLAAWDDMHGTLIAFYSLDGRET